VDTVRKFTFDDMLKNTFLETVRRTGLVAKAAKLIGTTMRRVRTECEADKDFGEEFKEALLIYAESIQEELHRRAVVGVQEDVYFQGVVCGQKTNYSDALLTTLVKAKSPEFREKLSVDTTIHGGVLLTLPPAASQQAWLDATTPAQLNAPPESEAHGSAGPGSGHIIDISDADESET
jgi:hypothetical protein